MRLYHIYAFPPPIKYINNQNQRAALVIISSGNHEAQYSVYRVWPKHNPRNPRKRLSKTLADQENTSIPAYLLGSYRAERIFSRPATSTSKEGSTNMEAARAKKIIVAVNMP